MTLQIMTQSLTIESSGIDLRKTIEFTGGGVLTTKRWEDYKIL